MGIEHSVPSHSLPLRQSDLAPVRDYYRGMLTGVQAVRQEGLTLAQAMQRFNLRTAFPVFREPPPGDWAYGMHERNIRNLWRILEEEQQPSQASHGNRDR